MMMDGLARDCGQFTMIHDYICHPTECYQTVTNSNAAHWRRARGLTRSIAVPFWTCFVFLVLFSLFSYYHCIGRWWQAWVFEGHVMM